MAVNDDRAVTIALQAVAYIIEDEDARAGLMRMTGLTPENLRAGLDDRQMLAGILGFLLANEPRLLTFCERSDIDPDLPAAAFRQLVGDDSDITA